MTKRAKLLVVEGKHSDYPAFVPALRRKGFDVEAVSRGNEALKLLAGRNSFQAAVVNAASLRSSGKRICQALHAAAENLPVLLVLDQECEVEKAAADVVLILPFTAQKLVNRIRHVLPGEGGQSLHVGPIRLDLETRVVRVLGRKTRLTPRLVRLLRSLMENHGAVVERRALFSQVWETDYTDDTRTLDVHVSWLREAIEPNPKKPKFLKTVRGVGYRLDI
ncbi:MAG: response regulator transcription factor [Anaerolineales bacterium]|nr:response regulator transcription factor [Anaerolineales bacterium]